jgi:proline iminopeptidase
MEAKKIFESTLYGIAVTEFYKEHACRLNDWPDGLNRSMKHANGEIYAMMQGPSNWVRS